MLSKHLVDGLLLVVVWAHVINAPYSKVEESFNMQAVHDLLYHGTNITAYDHHEFPGVVPRTFLGMHFFAALPIAALSYLPLAAARHMLGATKLLGLYFTRLVLGTAWVASLLRLKSAINHRMGPLVAAAFVLLTTVQFHQPFYASRTLPNVLAMPLTNIGLALWLEQTNKGPRWHSRLAVLLLTTAAVVIRCDMVLLLGLVGMHILFTGRLGLLDAMATGIVSMAVSLALTVMVDSVFWQRWLWPEGVVLWFNTAENR